MMMSKNVYQHIIIFTAVTVMCLIASRGLFSTHQLAGHDTGAYAVTQHQFHENIKEGVIFPRWAPDMRYGYGHIKLQYRPPLLHYLAEPFYIISENFHTSLHTALIILVLFAGFGMYYLCRQYASAPAALAGVAAYLAFHYFLGNLYLRGAYYEVAAYGCLPWVLWSQTLQFKDPSSRGPIISGVVAWTALACSHPQVLTLFLPIAALHALFSMNEYRNFVVLLRTALVFVCGMLIAAPYLYVAWREINLVRMELFLVNMEALERNFITFKTLLFETWPKEYMSYSWFDYLGRPYHREMRGLNWLALLLLIGVPFLWFSKRCRGYLRRQTIFFYICLVLTLVMVLPVSRGVWSLLPLVHTFNFPWRILGVSGLCFGLLVSVSLVFMVHLIGKRNGAALCVLSILVLSGGSIQHSSGWPANEQTASDNLTSEQIRHYNGIPQQFYTPVWVQKYADKPAVGPIQVVAGSADASLLKRTATEWDIVVTAITQATVSVSHYYYPGWRVYGLSEDPITPRRLLPMGIMAIDVPPGKHHFQLRFGLTTDRWIGYFLSILGLLMCMALHWLTGCFSVSYDRKT